MLNQLAHIRYWQTQWVLKRKWFLDLFSSNKSTADGDYCKYIILCDPRTGSTWLHTLLNSSSRIMSLGEYLTENKVPDQFLPTIWRPYHQSIQAVGCKVFYEQLLNGRTEHVFDDIAADPSIKIIDLTRENKLEMFASLKLAEKTGLWSSTQPMQAKTTVRIDKTEYKEFIDEVDKNRKKVLSQLSGHAIYSLTYEQLVADTTRQLLEIQSFLEVEPRPLFSLLRKQNEQSMTYLVDNYDDFE